MLGGVKGSGVLRASMPGACRRGTPRSISSPAASAQPRASSALLAEAHADARARLLHLGAGDRIGAIVGGVERGRAVVARKADPAERRGRRGAVGRPVPVDDAGADVGPEAVVVLRVAADQRGGRGRSGCCSPRRSPGRNRRPGSPAAAGRTARRRAARASRWCRSVPGVTNGRSSRGRCMCVIALPPLRQQVEEALGQLVGRRRCRSPGP